MTCLPFNLLKDLLVTPTSPRHLLRRNSAKNPNSARSNTTTTNTSTPSSSSSSSPSASHIPAFSPASNAPPSRKGAQEYNNNNKAGFKILHAPTPILSSSTAAPTPPRTPFSPRMYAAVSLTGAIPAPDPHSPLNSNIDTNTNSTTTTSNAPSLVEEIRMNSGVVRTRFIDPTLPKLKPRTNSNPNSNSNSKGRALMKPKRPIRRVNLCLMDMPDDVLRLIIGHISRPPRSPLVGGDDTSSVQFNTLKKALPLAYTCKRMYGLLYGTLDNVCLWCPTLRDAELASLARNSGSALRRLVVRGCKQLTDEAICSVVQHATKLREIDTSFCENISDISVIALGQRCSNTLQKVLLRKCSRVTDAALYALGQCNNIAVVDISSCALVTDIGVKHLVKGNGNALKFLSISNCKKLGDPAFKAIADHCTVLEQLCARSLSVTDEGFGTLCAAVGNTVLGIDVLDCFSLTRDAVLAALRNHCTHIDVDSSNGNNGNGNGNNVEGKTLRQIIITTLRANIFIVHGWDPKSGRDTIHMVLVDNGDIVSANILSAGTTDLSLLGVVLCKSFGKSLDAHTKRSLTRNYGILPSMLAD